MEGKKMEGIDVKTYFQDTREISPDADGRGEVDAARHIEFGGAPQAGDGADVDRRDFMKLVGTTFAAATAVGTSGCGRRKVVKAIPYVEKPETVTLGLGEYYATTSDDGYGLLVRSRDGRPVKVEGNPDHPVSRGATTSAVQASVVDLYDGDRLRAPLIGDAESNWTAAEAEALKLLKPYKTNGAKLAVLGAGVTGPARSAAVERFLAAHPGSRYVRWDGGRYDAIAAAHAQTHSKAGVPSYDFSRADVIVSFGADFLGTWLTTGTFAKQYAAGRKLSAAKKTMSAHVQVEAQLSLTGSNADRRVRVLPSQVDQMVLAVAGAVAKATGFAGAVPAASLDADLTKAAAGIGKLLVSQKGKALVVSSSTDVAVQAAVNVINQQVEAYGKTVDIDAPMLGVGGDAAGAAKLLADLGSGAVTGLVVLDVNPAFVGGDASAWAAAITKAPATIALCNRSDETASLCKLQAPVHHYLEDWGDQELRPGVVSLTQPLVRPLHDTRSTSAALLAFAGEKDTDWRAFVKKTWQELVLPRAEGKASAGFEAFWKQSVHDGFALVSEKKLAVAAGGPGDPAPTPAVPPPAAAAAAAAPAAAAAAAPAAAGAPAAGAEGVVPALEAGAAPVAPPPPPGPRLVATPAALFSASEAAKAMATPLRKNGGAGDFELVLAESLTIGDGSGANNPFLQELPDPLTKVVWDNTLSISPKTASEKGIQIGDIVQVKAGEYAVELPAVLQPGLHDGAVAVSLGYGRQRAGRIGNGVGRDVYPFLALGAAPKVAITPTGEKYDALAVAQTHPSYEHRDIVRETTLEAWQKDPKAGNPTLEGSLSAPEGGPLSIWEDHKYETYKWGLNIDLNSCTGCGACAVACHVENNVPMVGRREVKVRRDMFWLRIDRYYGEHTHPEAGGYDWESTAFRSDEHAAWLQLAENPTVVHQPVMCQHCENAPCETVCPVLATVHSREGLNAMAYNRCIGTRYCANNCPFKVRRFNWFQYPSDEMSGKRDMDLVALALNPDVVRRSRGVMEKCSMCVQRIQSAKSEIVRQGRQPTDLRDGDVNTACAQACPTDAITFGNQIDKSSALAKVNEDPRKFVMLDFLNVRPSVSYLTRVRNGVDV